MHVILGGAFNGKRAYVKQLLAQHPSQEIHYFEGSLPDPNQFSKAHFVVIGRLEQIIEQQLHKTENIIAREIISKLCELDRTTNVICICTDTSRGIVPLEQSARKIRDTSGRLYQQLCTYSERVTRIWYGIPQVIKETEKCNDKN